MAHECDFPPIRFLFCNNLSRLSDKRLALTNKMNSKWISTMIARLHMEWLTGVPLLRSDIDDHISTAHSSGISVLFPSLTVFLFVSLILIHDLLVPVHSPASIIAPTIAWAMLFLFSSIVSVVQEQQQCSDALISNNSRWLARDEVIAAMCFLLSHICAANGDDSDENLWSYVCTNVNSNNS